MIDFKKKKFEGNYGNDEEYKKLLADYTKTIQKDLAAVKTDFFYLGVHLFKLFIFLILYDIHAFYLICILYIFIRQIFL